MPSHQDAGPGALRRRLRRARAIERQGAAFALIVGAQHQHHVLDRDDQGERPDDQRHHTQDLHPVGGGAPPDGGHGGRWIHEGIDRAGAYVADRRRQAHRASTARSWSGRPSVPSGRSLQCRYRLVFGPSTLLRQSARLYTTGPTLANAAMHSCPLRQCAIDARKAYQPQALRKRPIVPAMPYSSASAVRPWPMDTSASPGICLARAGRLATVRS